MIDDIKQLGGLIKDNWSLCKFACNREKEVMVQQTIHAATVNLERYTEPFAIRGDNVFTSGGCVDNASAYQGLLAGGLFREEERTIDGVLRIVIFPTPLLIEKLKQFFKLPPYDSEAIR